AIRQHGWLTCSGNGRISGLSPSREPAGAWSARRKSTRKRGGCQRTRLFRKQSDAGLCDIGQTFAASTGVRDDLLAHARIPVTPQMICDVVLGLRRLLAREEGGDLIHHFHEMLRIHARQLRRRCGWAYTTWRSARAKPISVTPVSTARSMARAVGADTATI